MSRLEEIAAKFRNSNVPTTSKFRDESKQTKITVPRVGRLKKERKKKSKLLFLTEIALDFDPFLGEETEQYNRDCKFRPAVATESMMKDLKAIANENEATKKALLRKSGKDISEWDTTDVDTINDTDREVFLKHRYPSIYTIPACRVNIKSLTASKYGKDYRVDVTRDRATGKIVGDEPVLLQANRFFAMIAREEYNALVEENKVTNKYTEDDLKNAYSKIRDKTVLVSSDMPRNFAIAIEIPLNSKVEIPSDFVLDEWTPQDILSHLVLVNISSKIRQGFDHFRDGTYSRVDLYDNFYELDMYCTNDEDKAELGKNTSFEKASVPILEHKNFESFNRNLVEFLDNDNNLENIFQASNFIATFTPDLEQALYDSVNAIIPEDDPRLTENVVNGNQEFVSNVYSDRLFVKSDAGMLEEGSATVEEAEADESALKKAVISGVSGLEYDEDEFNI